MKRITERLLTAQAAKAFGRPRIDRAALRAVLVGPDQELVEYMEEKAKATGRPGANVAVMWRFFTKSVYASGDLPVLATREALQNGITAIKAAISARQIRSGAGKFDVVWSPESRSLTWTDNGIGMDESTILTKFLTIGETGVGGAESSEVAVGGFGVAKAVILGTSATFRWEMHTRNNRVVSHGGDQDVEIFEAPFLQGTRITIQDVSSEYDSVWDHARQQYLDIETRLRDLLSYNDLPDVELTFNGEVVKPAFSRRGGSRIEVDGSWGEGTTAVVKAYRRPTGDRQGGYYIRLGGQYQFKQGNQRGNLKADVVIDLTTTVRPGESTYPLTSSREALQGASRWTMSDIVSEVEKESESVGRSEEDEVYDPEDDPDGTAAELADLTNLAAEDEEFRMALQEAAGGLLDYYQSQVERTIEKPASTAPASAIEDEEAVSTRDTAPGKGIADLLQDMSAIEQQSTETPTGQTIAADMGLVRQVLQSIEKTSGASILTDTVEQTIQAATQSGEVSYVNGASLFKALDRAAETVMDAQGGGLMQAVAIQRAGVLINRNMDEEGRRYHSKRNPFGKLAGLRISKKNYDRQRAYRFRKNYGKWLPYLTLWDSVLRMIARETRMRVKFRPGFVLDDTCGGCAARTGSAMLVVYIHPDRFKEVVRAHRDRPMAIASYIHSVACHELTHVDGRMGEGHGESYVAAREDLGVATGHLLPVIAVLATRMLQLPRSVDPATARVEKLERKLQKVQADRGREVTELQRELRTMRKHTAMVKVISDVVLDPPAGLDASYLASFLIRHRDTLRKIVE